MKNIINYSKKIISIIAPVIFSYSCLLAQDKAVYYTDNGTKAVTSGGDCATLKDLSVKTAIASSMFKYDKIDFTIELKTNDKFAGSKLDEIYVFSIYFTQKKFNIQFEGKNEVSLWLCKPNDGDGDFLASDGVKISIGDLCGMTVKEKIDLQFSMWGYVQTGEKEFYNENTNVWEKRPTYDEGTKLSESSLAIKQTPENILSAKKAK